MALSAAIIATYITIHIARSPPSSHSETIAISLQQLQEENANPEGVAFRQRERASDIPVDRRITLAPQPRCARAAIARSARRTIRDALPRASIARSEP